MSPLTPRVSPQDHFAALLCRLLAPAAPPVAVANMRALCNFAHMVYDIAAQSSTLEADVRSASHRLLYVAAMPATRLHMPSLIWH